MVEKTVEKKSGLSKKEILKVALSLDSDALNTEFASVAAKKGTMAMVRLAMKDYSMTEEQTKTLYRKIHPLIAKIKKELE